MRLSTLIRTRFEHLRNERSTRAQIEARQLSKFRRLVRHAARHAPYYREIIETRGIDVARCVPQDFPVLTKTGLMANFDRIVTDRAITRQGVTDFLERSKDPSELYRGRYYVVHTSGTSGEVGIFVYDPKAWTRGISATLRARVGLRRHRLAFFGATHGHFAGASYASSMRRVLGGRIFEEVALLDFSAPLAPTLDALNSFQPTVLLGYPSALAILAEQQRACRLRIAPRQLGTSGEPLGDAERERIERTFGAPVIDSYVCTEHLVMGLSRAEYGGMYLFEDELIFELAADHTLVTNLFNPTLPLIRYRMSDVLVPRHDERRVLPFTLVEISGRHEHAPMFTNERGEDDVVAAPLIIAFSVRNVRRFRLRLVDRTACVLRVCLEPGLSAAEGAHAVGEARQRFGALLAHRQMRNVDCRIEVVADLPPDPKTGKFQLIVPAEVQPGGPSGPAHPAEARPQGPPPL